MLNFVGQKYFDNQLSQFDQEHAPDLLVNDCKEDKNSNLAQVKDALKEKLKRPDKRKFLSQWNPF